MTGLIHACAVVVWLSAPNGLLGESVPVAACRGVGRASTQRPHDRRYGRFFSRHALSSPWPTRDGAVRVRNQRSARGTGTAHDAKHALIASVVIASVTKRRIDQRRSRVATMHATESCVNSGRRRWHAAKSHAPVAGVRSYRANRGTWGILTATAPNMQGPNTRHAIAPRAPDVGTVVQSADLKGGKSC